MTSAVDMATTIDGVEIDMSNEALRGTPKRGGGRPSGGDYRLADGTRVPSVTTILGVYKDPGPLTRWAYQIGLRQGYAQGRDGTPPAGLYADRAAEIGSVVHDAAEHVIHGASAEDALRLALGSERGRELTDEQRERARQSLSAFVEWWDMVSPEVVATETPLVSERYRYGGTNDCVARLGRSRTLAVLDWKTGRGVYVEYKLQLSALAELWEENFGERIERAHCLRFDKRDGGFTHEMVPDLRRWFRAFLHLRDAYRIMYERD